MFECRGFDFDISEGNGYYAEVDYFPNSYYMCSKEKQEKFNEQVKGIKCFSITILTISLTKYVNNLLGE